MQFKPLENNSKSTNLLSVPYIYIQTDSIRDDDRVVLSCYKNLSASKT